MHMPLYYVYCNVMHILYFQHFFFSVQAHDGMITTLNCTTSYILSLGGDDKLCVWERFQGHLLNTLQLVSHVLFFVFTDV